MMDIRDILALSVEFAPQKPKGQGNGEANNEKSKNESRATLNYLLDLIDANAIVQSTPIT